ncbi:glycoside hydrolase family 47 protein [Streptomyces chiangmaiensis]|uniref:Glycoside hydrolase family 47 protein n=1 Tax=Streptomyces chiangmaiensis TaxID=766497 RepID=A0ABU7FPS7_9ACTN|nr:glycoside hydrolase family 47 protein [Streptomyces chiangmaiensis]MED7825863.1 glycoside hydrolase family 47 protein [Streptomyces chiangmaiensis]
MLRALSALGGTAVIAALGSPPRARDPSARASGAQPGAPSTARIGPPDPQKAREIRAEFLHAWSGYRKYAWGHDEVLPVSGGYREFFSSRHSVGLSIVEALDTHYVMGLDDEVDRCLRWIRARLDFDLDTDFHVFEAIIRLVGGLLAGHLATGDRQLLALSVDLADRLLPAFTKSPTGMPYRQVNLRTGAVSGARVPLAEIGTNILELGVLSQLTGDPRYFRAAKGALAAVVGRRSSLDLVGTIMDVESGRWIDRSDIGPNPPADSFYEYLWGGWAMFGDRDCLRWFRMFNASLRKHLAERAGGLLWFKQVDFRTGTLLGRRQSCLAACVLSVGGDDALAADYHRSWTAVQDRYLVLPEEIEYSRLSVLTPRNALRPEYANAAFDLYRRTGDPYYRATAWRYFQYLKTYHRVPGGYTIVTDVTKRPMPKGDYCPSYVFAENFKWLYLTFADARRFDYNTGYLSTEAKVLRGLRGRVVPDTVTGKTAQDL